MIPARGQLVLGTATLGLNGTREEAFALLDAFVELGGSIIDTAAVYSDWVPGEVRRAEGIIGEWRRQRARADIFICTKGAHPPLDEMSRSRLDAASITEDVEMSLRRLGVERLDLFYLHRDDPACPVEFILETLARLVEAGKVAAVGLSNWTNERVAAARRSGIVPIVSNQVLGNILCRHMSPPADPTIVRLDRGALRDAEATGSSLFLFSSQCGGYLSKRSASSEAGPAVYRNRRCADAADRLCSLSERIGIEPTTLAVGFLLAFSPSVFPIVGSRTVEQLRRSMAARSYRPDAAQLAELAAIAGFSEWR